MSSQRIFAMLRDYCLTKCNTSELVDRQYVLFYFSCRLNFAWKNRRRKKNGSGWRDSDQAMTGDQMAYAMIYKDSFREQARAMDEGDFSCCCLLLRTHCWLAWSLTLPYILSVIPFRKRGFSNIQRKILRQKQNVQDNSCLRRTSRYRDGIRQADRCQQIKQSAT